MNAESHKNVPEIINGDYGSQRSNLFVGCCQLAKNSMTIPGDLTAGKGLGKGNQLSGYHRKYAIVKEGFDVRRRGESDSM